MKTINKRAVRHYIREVKSKLSCSFSMKQAILKSIKQRIGECEPQTIEDLYREIGSPEKIADNIESIEDVRQLNKIAKKYRTLIVISVICIIIAIFASVLTAIVILSDDEYYDIIDMTYSDDFSQGE